MNFIILISCSVFCIATVTRACHRRCRDEIDEELIPHFSKCLAEETGDNTTDFTQLVSFVVYYDVWYQAIASSVCPYPSSFFALSESDTHFCWILQVPSLLPYGTKYYEPLKQCIFQFSTIRDKQRGGGPAMTPCHVSSIYSSRGEVYKQRVHDTCPKLKYTNCMKKTFTVKYTKSDGKLGRYDMNLIQNFVVNIRTDKCTITRKFFVSDGKPYIVKCPDSVKPPRPGHVGNPFTVTTNKQAEGTCFPMVLSFVLNSYEPSFIRAANACAKIEVQRDNERKRKAKERLARKKEERATAKEKS